VITKGAATREAIVAAAEELLLEHASEEAVSIRAVADAVGLTPPAIYRHFPDKHHLIFEVCNRQFARMADEVATTVGATDDPLAAIAAAARGYARFGLENPEHYRVMFMGHADHTPDQYADEKVMETGSFAFLVALVQEAMDDGALRPELRDASALAHTLWAAIHGVVSLAVAKPNLPAPGIDEQLDAMLDVVLHGIAR
jgi:AcrR family transcriptional regulator